MEGLIKGLADVAFAPDRQGNDETDSQPRDDRSRSAWSQVVSGEHEDHHGRSNFRTNYNTRPQEGKYGGNEGWESEASRRQQHVSYPQNEDANADGWETAHKKPSRQEEDDKTDGWETVSKKPSRRHHKVSRDQWKNYKRPPNEQDYSEEVSHGADMEPSEEELADLPKAAYKLWELDLNRLVPGKDYEIDLGEGKKVYQKEDMAEASLFSWLSDEVFRRPTYARFCSLLDNYNPHEGYKEVVTDQEIQEQQAFIEEISRTAPIKYLYKYLSCKGFASGSYQDFKKMMTTLWFGLYGRGGTSSCSSAFEHVFVGEIKRGDHEVSGFHNWIQFYLEEEKGRVDYQGYIFPRRRGNTPDSEMQLLTIQFEWNGVLKAVSSSLIGVSPEFEIALYTLCFYLGGEDNYLELGPYQVNVKCYRHGNRLGSAFPVTAD